MSDERQESFRPRILTQFSVGELLRVIDRFGHIERIPGEIMDDILKRMEPDEKKRQRLIHGINFLLTLGMKGGNLDGVKEVLVWNTADPNLVRFEIKKESKRPSRLVG